MRFARFAAVLLALSAALASAQDPPAPNPPAAAPDPSAPNQPSAPETAAPVPSDPEAHPRPVPSAETVQPPPRSGTGSANSAGSDVFVSEELLYERAPIVVAASKVEQKATVAPNVVHVITAEQIFRYGYRTLGDALRSLPGLWTTYDRAYEFIGIRGASVPGDFNTRIQVLINGHTLNEQWGASSPIGTNFGLDMDVIDRIEVILGPGSILYGSNAFFGVVNIVTKTGKKADWVRGQAAAGSFGRGEGTMTVGHAFDNGPDLFASAHYLDIEGDTLATAGRGLVEGADGDQTHSWFGRAAYKGFTINAARTERWKRVPTAPFGANYGSKFNGYGDDWMFVDAQYRHAVNEHWAVTGRWYADDYGYNDKLDYRGAGGIFRDEGIDRWWGGEVKVDFTEKRFRVTAGTEWQRHRTFQRANFEGTPTNDDLHTFYTRAGYLEGAVDLLDNVHLTAGVRYHRSQFYDPAVIPRAALVAEPWTDGSVKLIYGRAIRDPSVYERFFTDGITVTDNPGLTTEIVDSYQVEIAHAFGDRGQVGAVLFQNDIDGFIAQETVDVDPDPLVFDPRLQYMNGDPSTVRGVEAWARGNPVGKLQAFANVAYNGLPDGSDSAVHVGSPRLVVNAGATMPLWADKAYLSLTGHGIGERATEASGHVPPYWTMDATVAVRGLLQKGTISAGVYNVFDNKYQDPVGTEHGTDHLQSDGRTFLVKLSFAY